MLYTAKALHAAIGVKCAVHGPAGRQRGQLAAQYRVHVLERLQMLYTCSEVDPNELVWTWMHEPT